MKSINQFDIFINKMFENEIRSLVDDSQLSVLDCFDKYIINKNKLLIHNKDGYIDYYKKVHDVFLLHFIVDSQLILFNRYLKTINNKNLTNSELLKAIYNLTNAKKASYIKTDSLTEEDIQRINHNISIIEKLIVRNFFDYRDCNLLNEIVNNIKKGNYQSISNLENALDNFNKKIELDKVGLEEYIAIKLPFYLNIKSIDDRLLDSIETDYSQKR